MLKSSAIAAVAGLAIVTAAPVHAQDSAGASAAPAETSSTEKPSTQGGREMMPGMGHGRMQGPAHGMRRQGMRAGEMKPGSRRHAKAQMMGDPMMMRMLFIAIDTDGSGTLSLAEVLALHERLFKAADADGNGELTPEEMRAFMMGGMGG